MSSILSEIASCAQRGDWPALAVLLTRGEIPLDEVDRALLRILADGHPPAESETRLSQPTPGLIQALGRSPAVTGRLTEIARACGPSSAPSLLQAALVFDPGHPGALVALAWRRYARGDREQALALARRAREADPVWAEGAVALGWFLLESNEPDRAYPLLQEALTLDPSHAAARWYLGTLLYRQGRLPEAEALLREALHLAPQLDEARITLAWLLHDRGRLEEALHQCGIAVAHDALPHRLTLQGWLLARSGNERVAVGVLRRVVEQAPEHGAARAKLISILTRCGRHEEAGEQLQQGFALAPGDPELLLLLGWLQRERGRGDAAAAIARELTNSHPELGGGWHLLGLTLEKTGDAEQADACLARAQEFESNNAGLLLTRARLKRGRGQTDEAARLLEHLLDVNPGAADASLMLAEIRLGQGRPQVARRLLHRLLAAGGRTPEVWRLLALALGRLRRSGTAAYAIRRARRLAPESLETLRTAAWLGLETSDLAAAREAVRLLLARVPDDPSALAQAAIIALKDGAPNAAQRHAQRGLLLAPEDADCWWRLAQVRQHQGNPGEAERCLRTALDLQPGRPQLLGSLGQVLLDSDRLEEATARLAEACDAAPEDPDCRLDLARAQRLAGYFPEALEAAVAALDLRPGWAEARRLWSLCRMEQGRGAPLPQRDVCRTEAVAGLTALLRDAPSDPETALALVRLATVDTAAGNALRLIPRPRRQAALRKGLEWAVHHAGSGACGELAGLAREEFPDDPFIDCAALYISAAGGTLSRADLTQRLANWGRAFAMREGLSLPSHPSPRGRPLRVAYLASHLHGSLLLGVIAAHDRRRVESFLYTDAGQMAAAKAILQDAAVVRPLLKVGLADTLHLDAIDVVVDTVGLHPFHGQWEVLRALGRRAAPLQCGWLGIWGGGAGLYDALIADDRSLPAGAEPFHDEAVIRIPGGQWAWTPPLQAYDPGPPPCLARGHVTFGSTVRGFRLSRETLTTWARLLARVPTARLELLGVHSRDWRQRAEFAALLEQQGVDPARVGYRWRRPYAAHLGFFQGIDIHLDAFPGNGGLCSLDALWMGVPVVTLAGGGIGARQGLALLESVGCGEWAARTTEEYLRMAEALASDPAGLERWRAGLRQRLLGSPLVDGRRVAAALETAWEGLLDGSAAVAAAADLKSLGRALAQRRLAIWLRRCRRLAVPAAARPEVSVVMVLYNQAGLTLQALTALAEQQGVAFETIVVDNGSSDATGELLQRIDGIRVLRNEGNAGFLQAANQGAAVAAGRHVLFLNNDVVLQAGALRAALERIESADDVGVVGGRIVLADGSLQEAGSMLFADGSALGYGRGRDPEAPEFRFVREVDFCSGAFLLVRADLWRSLGGFDPAYAPAYYEDADLCLRARAAGFRVLYEPRAALLHLEGGSAGDGEPMERMEDNRTAFLRRHARLLAQRPLAEGANLTVQRWAARPRPRILVVDDAVPRLTAGSGFGRARRLIEALDRHHVTLYPMHDGESDWSTTYRALPDTVEVMLGRGEDGLETFLEERRGLYQVLLVSRPHNMTRIGELRGDRPELFDGLSVVYDAEAVFALRDIARAVVLGRPLPRASRRRHILRELELVRHADRVLSVSERDARLFRAVGFRDLRLVAHAQPIRADTPGQAGRQGLLFVGALNPDTPNEDGLLWLVREVMPRVHAALPGEVPLTIVGECRSSRIAGLAAPGVRLAGRIDDLRPLYDGARLFVAPARYAGGIPLKVLEAAGNGLPVVASALLARQLGWTDGSELLTARDAETFAAAIIRLYQDDALWLGLRRAMVQRLARQFDPGAFAEAVRAAVEG